MTTAAQAVPRRARILAIIFVALLGSGLAVTPAPALAQDTNGPAAPETPGALVDEAVRNFLSAIELFLFAIPQYAAPEVLPNGDILIRRIPREGGGEGEGDAAPGGDGESLREI